MNAPRLHLAAALCAAALLAPPAAAGTATVTRAWQFKPADAAGLRVDNLIGSVSLTPAAEGGFHVTATINTDAEDAAAAEALAAAVEFRSQDAGAKSGFQVLLPAGRFPLIHDPGAPRGLVFGRSYVNYLGERREISPNPRKAARVRVDLTIRVPAGASLAVDNRLGAIESRGVAATLRLETGRGSIAARDGRGTLGADTGSGAIAVANQSGDLDANTGSGEISIVDCACRIGAKTGAGRVRILRGRGSVSAGTGSGEIELRDFAGPIRADTGSGDIVLSGVSAAEAIEADTGSGDVRIAGDLSGLERLDIDTGSGDVELRGAGWPDMRISIGTGSGSIEAEVPDAELVRSRRNSAELTLGDGRHRGRISTGSGDISLTAGAPASAS